MHTEVEKEAKTCTVRLLRCLRNTESEQPSRTQEELQEKSLDQDRQIQDLLMRLEEMRLNQRINDLMERHTQAAQNHHTGERIYFPPRKPLTMFHSPLCKGGTTALSVGRFKHEFNAETAALAAYPDGSCF
jgi:hypothetical protein